MIKKLIFNDLNNINNKILKIIYILSLLIPAFLLTGPFLPDLCLSIIALIPFLNNWLAVNLRSDAATILAPMRLSFC